MKNGVLVVALLIILVISVLNHFRVNTLEEKLEAIEKSEKELIKPVEEEDIELGDVMTKLQRHSNKLWFAGIEKNWPLAAFYIHELEETFEILTEGEIIDEGVDISMLTASMGLGPLERVEDAVKSENPMSFLSSYANLLQNCNSCHMSSNHAFVVIKTPTSPAYDNQKYEVVK